MLIRGDKHEQNAVLHMCSHISCPYGAALYIPGAGRPCVRRHKQGDKHGAGADRNGDRAGKSLADGDVLETFLERFEKNFQAEPVSAVVSAEPTASQAPPPTPSPTPEATAHPTPEPTIHPAVAVFMEAQSAYSAYAVPETVSYERPELPFEYSSPVAGVTSSGFGYRMHPIKNEVKYHYGTDLAANTGTPITAFADGSIVAQGDSDSFGKYVMIDHPDGYRTLYAHCSKLCMNCGAVKKATP